MLHKYWDNPSPSFVLGRADERDYMQKIIFTKWINAQLGCDSYSDIFRLFIMESRRKGSQYDRAAEAWGLNGACLAVEELFDDLKDGRILLRLLEMLSGSYVSLQVVWKDATLVPPDCFKEW